MYLMKKILLPGAKLQQSMTEGPIWKGLIYFAIPIFFGNLFQQLYNTADTLIVGNFLGKEALAAVASSGNLIFMMVGFLHGMAMGAGVLIAKHYGAKDYRKMRTAIHTDIAFCLVAGLALTVVGVVLTPHILRWMGTPENVLPNSIAYFRTYFLGSSASFLYNVCTGILQAVGNSRHPLYYLVVSSIVNVVLDILFVGVFHWGVWSAAFATVISQIISASLCVHKLLTTTEEYRVRIREIKADFSVLKQIVKFGLPSGVQNALFAISNIVIQSSIVQVNNAVCSPGAAYQPVVKGNAAAANIAAFGNTALGAAGHACISFTSQNYGAKNYDRVKRVAAVGYLLLSLVGLVATAVLMLLRDPLLALYGVQNAPDELAQLAYSAAKTRVLWMWPFYILHAWMTCGSDVLRGLGKSMLATVSSLIGSCLLRIVWIYTAFRAVPKLSMVYVSYPITWFLTALALLLFVLREFKRFEKPGTAQKA